MQEAVCVGMKAAMTEDDAVITAYRAHGWTYMMGVPIIGVLAELAGWISHHLLLFLLNLKATSPLSVVTV